MINIDVLAAKALTEYEPLTSLLIRVTVINSTNAGRHAFKEAIMKCMSDAGFMWQSTNTARSDREFYLVMDFSYSCLIN